jgi:hypothetical protein
MAAGAIGGADPHPDTRSTQPSVAINRLVL